ncbi:MAG: FACT complex subunit spt16 [Trizodia sp. TS-e1964]|nr:MAG: FACT complex subunit spt16 [Trizodia sp. TS-e1964]
MGDEIRIDKQIFHDRLSRFITAWKADKRSGDALFGGVGSIVVVMGKSEELSAYQKNNAVHFWLLGYEFPATLLLFTTEKLYIVTTAKKAKHLDSLKGGKTPIEFLVRGKDNELNTKIFHQITDVIKSLGNKVGLIAKDASSGPFIDEWKKAYESISDSMQEVDISTALSAGALAVKDENELRAMRNSSKACVGIMKFFVEEMSEILDQELKVTHKALSDRVDGKLDDSGFFKSMVDLKLTGDFDNTQLDWCYGPIVQSGGKYDLRLTAAPDDNNLHAGAIIAAFGLRYKSYCSILARTYLVDPNKPQESVYKLLLTVHEVVLKEIRDGVLAKDVYNKAISIIKSKKPDLEKHFVKSVGGGIGIETRDSTLVINSKNPRALRDGMTLVISTGFNDVKNPEPQDRKSGTYSLLLSDTIRVQRGDDPILFTGKAASDLESTSFFFKEEEEEPAPKPIQKKRDSRIGAVAAKNITQKKLRGDRGAQLDAGVEAKRREHQKELAKKKQEEGMEKFAKAKGVQNNTAQKQFKRFESYKRDNQFPSKVKELMIVMDLKNSTIVLPIMGRPVPFHINTIKNASQNEEGDYSYLRINFLSPGQGVGRKDDQPFEDPTAQFVRSLTFRSKDGDRMHDISTQISDMKKSAVRKEQEKKELEDVVEQDKLVEIRNRRPQRLSDVFVRPALDGKRTAGEVEIHQNGLRYAPPRHEQRIDILFSNVKHLFFQPCQGELIVLIHVHLINPIMIGKKKTKDVQFYREATDIQFDETGNRKRKYRYGDEEEFEAEQEERKRRAQLDKEFKTFAEKVSEAGRSENVDVDIPFRELGFNGVPNRANVYCQPSTDCLVQLTEPPFTVITLEEIEIAHLERVQFGLKNFDMVLVFKDFHRPVFHINTIPVESLEGVKEWLDSVNIPFSEGPLNLNWPTIMKTITSDPHAFFADGGWSFLSAESDDEQDDEEEEESAFEMSDSELAASDESSDDDSEFDEDASAESAGASEESESGGEDWDVLEKKAARKDRDGELDDDEEKPKKKRR